MGVVSSKYILKLVIFKSPLLNIKVDAPPGRRHSDLIKLKIKVETTLIGRHSAVSLCAI